MRSKVLPAGCDSGFAISRAQREIWMAHQADPARSIYNISEYIEINGSIDEERFETALREVVREAESLNVCFAEHCGELRQFFVRADNWYMPVVDLSAQCDPKSMAKEWMKADLSQPVDLSRAPLFTFALFKIASDKFIWYLRFHHIVADGYSRGIFAQRVAEVYTNLVTGSDRHDKKFSTCLRQLENEASYRRSEQFTDDRDYWLGMFGGQPSLTSFSGLSAPASNRFLRQTIHIPQPSLERLGVIGRSAGAGWKQVIIAAIAVYAYRITGVDDIILTLPVSGRMSASSRRVLGMMSNALPLRLALHSSMALSELVRQVSIQVRELLCHQGYRGEDLWRDGCSGGPCRKAGLTANLMPFDYNLSFAGCSTEAFNLSNGPVDDFSISVYERSDARGLCIDLDANPALYSTSDLDFHHAHFLCLLLDVIASDPGRSISSLNLLSSAERRQIISDWNNTFHPLPHSTLPLLFEQQVQKCPDSTAVILETQSLTYCELNARANRLAHYLIKAGIGPEDIVGLAMERSIECVISILAIMKAGAAYLPLAPDYPTGRLSFMIQDANPACIITTAAIASRLPSGAAFLLLDDPQVCAFLAGSCVTDPSDEDRIRPLTPLNPAYVMYTSGSTGIPKGVVVSHSGIPSLAFSQIEHLAFTAESRLLQFVSMSFDVSLFDLCLALLSGAALVLAPGRLVPGEELAAYAADRGVTHLNVPASILCMMSPESLASCPNLIIGGESAAPHLVEHWSKGRRMISAYGPTETTVCATMSDPLAGAIVPPLGRPIWNTRVYVLDAGLEPAPAGVCGELYIAGDGLARGYLGNPGLTAERFIACPFGPPGARMYRTGDLARWRADGTLEFLGRADRQVKIRGFRIEPTEIEAVLGSMDGIGQAAVVPREIAGEVRLVAYLAAPPGQSLPALPDLRANIAALLPSYMVPAHWVTLSEFPLTANGKVDRRALPDPDIVSEVDSLQPPRGDLEAMLYRLFVELTGNTSIGRDDNFFELGGSSFGAITLVTRFNKATQGSLSVRTVFEQPTIRQLALAAQRSLSKSSVANECGLMNRANNKLPRVYLFPGIYGDQLGLARFRVSLEGLVDFVLIHYPDWCEMLGSSPVSDPVVNACTRQVIEALQDDTPLILAAYSFGGAAAYETAQRLIQLNYRVHLLCFIDVCPPLVADSAAASLRTKIRDRIGKLLSQKSIQSVFTKFRALLDRIIDWSICHSPASLSRVLFSAIMALIPPALAHSFTTRLLRALRVEYLSRWSPKAIQVPITLFRSDDPKLGSERTCGWERFCPALNVISIGGDHFTILDPPQLALLSKCFMEAIGTVQVSNSHHDNLSGSNPGKETEPYSPAGIAAS
jgi:nonribosomal peptide synthetase DhbF